MMKAMSEALAFKPDHKLVDVLSHGFTLSAEVIPPRNGAEQGRVLEQIRSLIQSGAEFLAVTKGAGGSLRGGSLPIAQTIKEQFKVPCIAHFTCRDLSKEDVENQLMDHHYFGIRNILALRGDPPDGNPQWKPREGGHSFAYELIEQIRNLNQGRYLKRVGGAPTIEMQQEATDFCIGAAAYPEHPDREQRVEYFRLKVEAGAQFGITDMIFDPELYASFIELCATRNVHVPILPGTRLLKTKGQAARMAAKFRVSVPPAVLDSLPDDDGPDAISYGVELLMKRVERLKALGAPGIHLYVIADTLGATTSLRQLAQQKKQGKS